MRLKLFLSMFLLCCSYFANAQDKINNLLELYGKKNDASGLFVHYDKNIYTNNETIWFTAYVLNNKIINQPSIFSVAVVRDLDSTLILQKKFVLQDGFAYGNFALPDTILTGDYRLIAYTNELINDKPKSVFIQKITVKTTLPQSLNLVVKNMGEIERGSKTAKIMASVTNKNNSFLPKPATITYTYGKIKNTKLTDITGQLMIELPLQSNNNDPNLDVKVKFGPDSGFARLPVKVKPRKAIVKFYPEGGNLIENLRSKVAYEVKDQYGSPLAVRGFLYKDNNITDTIETTSYGIGNFSFTPKKGSTYFIKLDHQDLTDSTYALPAINADGLMIGLKQAISNDTLRLTLKTNTPKNVRLYLHNFKTIFALTNIKLKNNQNIAISLADMPKGIATITVTDSLDRPLAERMCFLHYDKNKKLTISTDSGVYAKRQQVNLSVKLVNTTSQGVVSIACVQDNRIDINKLTDIEQYTYLEREMTELPIPPFGKKLDDQEFLENILLVKGWRRYTWNDMLKVTPKDTVQKTDSLTLKGIVLKNNKKLNESVDITLLNGADISLLKSDNAGVFFPAIADLAVTDEKTKLLFTVNGKNKYVYTLTFDDQFVKFNKKIPALFPAQNYISADLGNNTTFIIPKEEKLLQIQAVDIAYKKDNSLFGVGDPGPNECGDWVCVNNILNCINHGPHEAGSTKPIEGKMYTQRFSPTVPYYGCKTQKENSNLFEGIDLPKEFYTNSFNDKSEPAFFSTILWKHAVVLEPNKPTQITFYTGDISGKFRVIVQGITRDDVVAGGSSFEVR